MVPAVLALLCSTPAFAQGTLQHLAQFSGDQGVPKAGLIRGADGALYGTTEDGGKGYGSVFRIDPAAATPKLTTVYAFSGGGDGYFVRAPLLLATDGNFYGTTVYGGAADCGTVFKLTPAGTALGGPGYMAVPRYP